MDGHTRGRSHPEDKAKKKRDQELGIPDEIKSGQIRIGDYEVPDWAAKVIEHTSAFAPVGFGLGLSQVYQNNIVDGKTTAEAATNSAMAQVNHIIGSLPQIENFAKPLATGITDKLETGKWDDVDVNGNPMKREAFNISDYLTHVYDKKGVLSEKYYKDAVKNQKYYREKIEATELNTSISEKEKSDLRDQYLKQLKESTDEIYRLNKEQPQ